MNILGTHDSERILTIYLDHFKDEKKAVKLLKLSSLLQMTFPGVPCIYYGDEIGMTGGHDPFCRKCMEWNPENQDREMYEEIKHLVYLRKTYPLLANDGDLQFIEANDETNHFIFTKENDGELLVCIFNHSEQPLEKKLPINITHLRQKYVELFTGQESDVDGNSIDVLVKPFGYQFLLFEKVL